MPGARFSPRAISSWRRACCRRHAIRGELHFTSRWPKQPVSFEGKRIGVVGTGSSGIQAIPVIAREAGRLTVFQRTANYSVPAQNGPHDPVWLADYKSRYAEIRAAERKSGFATYWSAFEVNPLSALEVTPEEREREYEWRWNRGGTGMMVAFRDLLTDLDANRTAADFVRAKIRDIVKDPETARKLQPAEDQPISCRRLCVDTGYYDTFNRPNVDLIHLGEDPIERITSHGVQTRSNSIELDMLILATGFDPVTGALSRIDIRGRDGIELKEKWKDGPRSYLGIVGSGFPNLFAVNGPLGVNGNFVTASELVVDWIAGLIRFAETNGYGEIDATKQAEDGWVEHVRVGADRMTALQTPTCNAWWAKRREADGRRIFLLHMEGIGEYMKLCDEIAAAGYRGFDFRA
jgi:cation diffusion facilitator CzcD-associated flavoprotein CzcO